MKRFFSLMLILALCAILAGCSASAPDNLKKAWKVDQSSIGYLRQNVEGMDSFLVKDDVELRFDLTGRKAEVYVRRWSQDTETLKLNWEADDSTITFSGKDWSATFDYKMRSSGESMLL
ncbi:MAG: hypothetical protein IJC56_02580 [Clostridia bacterium]|nr:hypothetical protein [Clostridia bacterium]